MQIKKRGFLIFFWCLDKFVWILIFIFLLKFCDFVVGFSWIWGLFE